MTPGRNSVERIRRHEVSRALKKVNLSPEEAGIIDLLSRSLVRKLLDGPISEVVARAEAEIPFAVRPGAEASCEPEGHAKVSDLPGRRPPTISARVGRATSSAGATESPASLHDPLERREEPVADPSASPGFLGVSSLGASRQDGNIFRDSSPIHSEFIALSSNEAVNNRVARLLPKHQRSLGELP